MQFRWIHFGKDERWKYYCGSSYVVIRLEGSVIRSVVDRWRFGEFVSPSEIKLYIHRHLRLWGRHFPETGTPEQFKEAVLWFFDPDVRAKIQIEQKRPDEVQRVGRKRSSRKADAGTTR